MSLFSENGSMLLMSLLIVLVVKNSHILTIIWVDFLGVPFEVGGGKIVPLSKLVRIMLQT